MEALEHGVSDYVVKPVNELILKEKIHRLLDISHEDH
jgi:YesN/AraC family two-component response regulator